ncbi:MULTISPECIES: response regulator transcription factor [unclassified Janthinobacterium]|uniref:response regulator transcription factor n=1 Tax=unclassified Janthinobacterium TaxID=2610881 RepID=UPI000C1728CB|nr:MULTISPECIES: response regulator [unclassified Janthinobacterium]MDN2678800.1 response regulator [Janthinobacterium sp. SUN033]MDO8068163.1 response regulator [Janthinobacterium sp. SUN206]MDO8074430.1 response regulator [Janthinobacterium sp. SUN176]PIF10279.1 LuxR family two component transcriptional regulator [Janthinobacterium sp. 13]
MNESDAIIFVVDDDAAMRRSLAYLFDSAGWKVETFESARDFLQRYAGHVPGCLLLDVRMPLMSGLELQQELNNRTGHAISLPVIFLSGHGDLAMAVQTMKAGACDFLEKPCKDQVLLDAVSRAVARSVEESRSAASANTAQSALARLTAREREVALLMAEGKASKVIARELGISDKTVQVHRHNTMEKLGLHSAAEVARLLMAGGEI